MNNGRQRLKGVLERGEFAVTVEFNPPKGTNVSGMLDHAKALVGRVHGVNVTDNTAAVMRASSLAVCRLLYEQGHDPVMQVTCRDRNRIGIHLLGAHLLGMLCLTGDSPTVGDHKEAKPMYDLDSVQIMQAIGALNQGRDLAGEKLDGSTEFLIGGAVSPDVDPIGPMHAKFAAKVGAGAQFFQTQAVYNPEKFRVFMKEARQHKGKVLAGILVLRSVKMAEFINANIPGIEVPDELIAELRSAGKDHELEAGIDIAVRMIKAISSHYDGVHIMAVRAVDRLPEILTKASLG